MHWPLFSFPTVATWTLSTLIPKIHFGNQINSNKFNASFIGYWRKSTKDNSAYWHRKVLYTSPQPGDPTQSIRLSVHPLTAPRCYIHPSMMWFYYQFDMVGIGLIRSVSFLRCNNCVTSVWGKWNINKRQIACFVSQKPVRLPMPQSSIWLLKPPRYILHSGSNQHSHLIFVKTAKTFFKPAYNFPHRTQLLWC